MTARNAHKSTFTRGQLPAFILGEDRGYKQCEQPFHVLAHLTENGMYYNDVELVFQNVILEDDEINVVVEKNGVELPLRGIGVFCPKSPNATVFLVEWQKYLQNEGVGCYTVKLNGTIAGVNFEQVWGKFELEPWTIDSASGTVRLYSRFNSFALNHNIDFSGSNAVSSIRFRGFFGLAQPNTRINNLRSNNNIQTKVTRENVKSYTLESDLLNSCHTERIIDLHLLHENTIWLCDHNAQNHSYKYKDIELIVTEVPEIDYQRSVRGAKVSAIFEDKQPFYKSKYRDSSPISDIVPVPVCNPVQLNINEINEGSFPSGSTIDLELTDGTTPVTPTSVVVAGQSVTVTLPKPLELIIQYLSGSDTSEITIVTGSGGVITSADTTGLTGVIFELNTAVVSLPITLAVNDLLAIKYDSVGADGVIKLIGTYA
jgi:hypothetical protein